MPISTAHTQYRAMDDEALISHVDTVLEAAYQHAKYVTGILPEWTIVMKELRDRLDDK